MVSNDEVEDLLDITTFMNVSSRAVDSRVEIPAYSNLVRLPTSATSSNRVTAGTTCPNPDIDLSALIRQRNVVGSIDPTSAAESPSAKLSSNDFLSLGPIYCIEEVSKNKQQFDITKMPNAILQMAYLKLYILLSMLTTSALSKIQSNDSLKYHKVPFGNGAR